MLWVRHTHDHVLNTDAELSLLVEARFVRDTHTFGEFHLVATTDTVGALVTVEIVTDSVASTMLVIKADFPQVSSREEVHVCASDGTVHRPDDTLEVEVAEQDSSVSLLLEGCRGYRTAKVSRSGDVCRAIQVLTT